MPPRCPSNMSLSAHVPLQGIKSNKICSPVVKVFVVSASSWKRVSLPRVCRWSWLAAALLTTSIQATTWRWRSSWAWSFHRAEACRCPREPWKTGHHRLRHHRTQRHLSQVGKTKHTRTAGTYSTFWHLVAAQIQHSSCIKIIRINRKTLRHVEAGTQNEQSDLVQLAGSLSRLPVGGCTYPVSTSTCSHMGSWWGVPPVVLPSHHTETGHMLSLP